MGRQVGKSHPYGQSSIDLLCGHPPNVGTKRPDGVMRGTGETSTDRRKILRWRPGDLSRNGMEGIISSRSDLRCIVLMTSSQPISLIFISTTPRTTDGNHCSIHVFTVSVFTQSVPP